MAMCTKVFGASVYVELNPVGYDEVKHVRYGVEGTCDVKGYLRPWGGKGWAIPFQIEVKTGKADLEKHQKAWAQKCQDLSVLHMVVTTESESEMTRVLAAAMNVLRLAQDGQIKDTSTSFRIE